MYEDAACYLSTRVRASKVDLCHQLQASQLSVRCLFISLNLVAAAQQHRQTSQHIHKQMSTATEKLTEGSLLMQKLHKKPDDDFAAGLMVLMQCDSK